MGFYKPGIGQKGLYLTYDCRQENPPTREECKELCKVLVKEGPDVQSLGYSRFECEAICFY